MKATHGNIMQLNKRQFKEKIFDYTYGPEWKYKGDKPAVIDFYADWCVPCKTISPILAELSVEFAEKIKVYKINTEKDPEVSKAFGISSIPTLLFIPKTGKPAVIRGVQSRQSLKNNMEKLLPEDERKGILKRLLSLKW